MIGEDYYWLPPSEMNSYQKNLTIEIFLEWIKRKETSHDNATKISLTFLSGQECGLFKEQMEKSRFEMISQKVLQKCHEVSTKKWYSNIVLGLLFIEF